MSGFGDWFMGRTAKQQEAQRRVAEHPGRSMAVYGVTFGLAMAVMAFLLGAGWIGAVVGGVLGGAVFGVVLVLVVQRQQRR